MSAAAFNRRRMRGAKRPGPDATSSAAPGEMGPMPRGRYGYRRLRLQRLASRGRGVAGRVGRTSRALVAACGEDDVGPHPRRRPRTRRAVDASPHKRDRARPRLAMAPEVIDNFEMTLRSSIGAAGLLLGVAVVAHCGGGNYRACDSDRECGPLAEGEVQCCTEPSCRGPSSKGVCLRRCDSDRDCPTAYACAEKHCFATCDDDRDCAAGFDCRGKGGRNVCAAD
jgi:hypothetical protein